jgi:hypothetical protein
MLMYKMSLAIGASANSGGWAGPWGPGEPCCAETAHAADVRVVCVIELVQRFLGGACIVESGLVSGQPAEMGPIGRREPHDEVRETPGDRGDGFPLARRHGVVHGELARSEGDRRRALAAAADGPATGDRLPGVSS